MFKRVASTLFSRNLVDKKEIENMFIDTATANNRTPRPQIVVSPHTSPYNDSSTPLLETFVGQEPPPTYLEATTPGLYTSRLSGEEGARLLSFDGREAQDAAYKEEQYRRKSLREQCLKRTWVRWTAAILAIIVLSTILAALFSTALVRGQTQVCRA